MAANRKYPGSVCKVQWRTPASDPTDEPKHLSVDGGEEPTTNDDEDCWIIDEVVPVLGATGKLRICYH